MTMTMIVDQGKIPTSRHRPLPVLSASSESRRRPRAEGGFVAFACAEQSPQVHAFGFQPHISIVLAGDLDNP